MLNYNTNSKFYKIMCERVGEDFRTWLNRKYWDEMVVRDMNKDVSWQQSAKQYKDMYVELTPKY